jgi:hypothetical protein
MDVIPFAGPFLAIKDPWYEINSMVVPSEWIKAIPSAPFRIPFVA